MRNIHNFLLILTLVVFGWVVQVSAQTAIKPAEKAALREQALKFVEQNRYLDAFPLLEKVAPLYPNDAEIWAHYGIAILTRSSTLSSADERKAERVKGMSVLAKAKELGTKNDVALNFLEQFPADGGDEDNFGGNPEFEKNLREGEAFFGRGEYEKAFAAYEKAYKINPQSYEAVLFMGDSHYAAGRFKESEPWFAKAAAINPDREQAFRFWGDALLNQKKMAEARDKFIDALVAEPYSRLTWGSLERWAGESGAKVVSLAVVPPGGAGAGEILFDESLLKTEDGTASWKLYKEARKAQVIANGSGARALAGEVNALRKVAAGFRNDLKAGKIKYPDQSLSNLVRLDDAGLLEPYVLLIRADGDIADEYAAYRQKNRDKIKKFVIEFMLGLSK